MFVLFLFLCLAVSSPPVLAEEMTEQQALQRLSIASPRARALALQVELARAAARTEGLYPNPSVTYSREDAAGTPETYLLYQQPLSINGRRQFLRRAAEASAESTELAARMQLYELRQDLRLAFLQVLFLQEQSRQLRSECAGLAEILEILKKREKAGESSGYDRIRADRELSMLRAEAGNIEAMLDRSRAELASFFDPAPNPETLAVTGSISPPGLPDMASLIARSATRPDIQAEQKLAENSDLLREAAHRKLYPDPVVSGGFKSPSIEGRRETGYVLSVTVPLPLFDRGKTEISRAEAAKRASLARAEALASELKTKLAGAWRETRARRRAVEEFRNSALSQSEDLIRIARAAYEGGEVGILELLDAYRTRREAGMHLLVLTGSARRAALEMERLAGEEVIQ